MADGLLQLVGDQPGKKGEDQKGQDNPEGKKKQ